MCASGPLIRERVRALPAVQGRLFPGDVQRGNRRLAAHRQWREPATSHSCGAGRTASRPAVARPHSAPSRSDCSPDGRAATLPRSGRMRGGGRSSGSCTPSGLSGTVARRARRRRTGGGLPTANTLPCTPPPPRAGSVSSRNRSECCLGHYRCDANLAPHRETSSRN